MKEKTAKSVILGFLSVLFLITFLSLNVYGEVPQQINYQGFLTETTGNPAPDGDYEMSFALYDVHTGGTALWSEAQTVAVSNGIYNVTLGQEENELNPIDFEGDCYLGVTVGSDNEMSPRQKLTSVGYALRAQVAESVATGAVTTIMIQDAAVDTAKVADNAITESKIGDATVTAGKMQDGAVLAEILDDDGANSGLDADLLDGFSSNDFSSSSHSHHSLDAADGSPTNAVYVSNLGDVGIGTTSPSAKLDVDPGTNGPAATIGYANTATGNSAIAMGYGTEALHQYATAMGNQTNATGFDSTAMGYGTTASGSESTAMGHLTTASGSNSTAMGYGTTASGSNSTAMGGSTTASNSNSTAMGYGTTASGHLSTAMGNRMIAQGDNSFGIGLNDTLNAITQDNTMAIMGGDVGIGTTAPAAKLHVITASGWGVQGEHSNGNYGVLGDLYAGVIGESIGIGVLAINNGPGPAIIASNTSTGDIFRGQSPSGVVFKVSNDGTTTTSVLEITGGSDLAEPFEIGPADIAGPGTVVCIDPENPGELEVSRTPYDRRVAGIISGAGGINPGMVMGQEGSQADGSTLVALTGRVFCRANASNGPIQPGDLLTTSDIPGHAMKVTDYTKAQGAIIGKSMSSLKQDQGLVLVLVTLQ